LVEKKFLWLNITFAARTPHQIRLVIVDDTSQEFTLMVNLLIKKGISSGTELIPVAADMEL
jgi:hypothetical protein